MNSITIKQEHPAESFRIFSTGEDYGNYKVDHPLQLVDSQQVSHNEDNVQVVPHSDKGEQSPTPPPTLSKATYTCNHCGKARLFLGFTSETRLSSFPLLNPKTNTLQLYFTSLPCADDGGKVFLPYKGNLVIYSSLGKKQIIISYEQLFSIYAFVSCCRRLFHIVHNVPLRFPKLFLGLLLFPQFSSSTLKSLYPVRVISANA
ncbi:hypothetical protein G9A89_005910 [Geosiphon pyriformis]|nr:hypothetical protein G9A89_005910 [Geosiphon pyriformis]